MEESVTAKTLLNWRLTMLNVGGEASALDWLLDLKGGVRWQQLQALRLYPESTLTLEHGLETLEELWRRHLREQIPLQYLVGLCPWRDLELKVAPGVLIPRQETELLVDLAVGCLSGEERQSDLHCRARASSCNSVTTCWKWTWRPGAVCSARRFKRNSPGITPPGSSRPAGCTNRRRGNHRG